MQNLYVTISVNIQISEVVSSWHLEIGTQLVFVE